MAETAKMYGLLWKSLANKEVNLSSDTLKCMLCTSSYVPDQDTHQYKSSVTGEVAAGGGYSTGGVTLANVSVTYDAASNTLKLDADDPNWANATISAAYAVYYDDTPATNKPLIAYVDFGGTKSSSASNFTIVIDTAGILNLTAA